MSLEQEIARLKAELAAREASAEAVPAVLAEVDYSRRRIAWLERERDALAAQLRAGAEQASRLAAYARDGGEVPAWPEERTEGHDAGAELDWQGFQARAFAPDKEYAGIWVQESSIDWSHSLHQRPQHMAMAMARRGWLVVYQTTNASHDRVAGWREVQPGLWLTNDPASDVIEGAVRSVYNTCFGQPLHVLRQRAQGSRLVFEVVDHLDAQLLGSEQRADEQRALQAWALGGGADLVVATARRLHEQVSGTGIPCALVPNGVDVSHYRDPARLAAPVDPRLADFRARFPVLVGYFGAIAPWLDFEAIEGLARARPDVGFVFIGMDFRGGAARLPRLDNLLAFGPVDYAALPAHGRRFDACLIPFAEGEVARSTSPLKLFEYFALEKPVVVSSVMDECVAFPEVFHGLGAAGLAEALDRALAAAQAPGFRARLAALADENSWDARAEALERALASAGAAGEAR